MTGRYHVPVLLPEVLAGLAVRPGGRALDLTLGGGGHAEALAEAVGPGGRLVGVDQDRDALAEAGRRLAGRPWVTLVQGNFEGLEELLDEVGIQEVDAALMDLGVSSHQLDRGERGFSFRHDGPLDMRMDARAPMGAAELLESVSEEELRRILGELGEERFARRVARRICQEQRREPIRTTGRLAKIVEGALPAPARFGPIHPATRTFQALRIAVNRELEVLERGLGAALGRLAPGGRLAVISYHSLEDRIVKRAFRQGAGECRCPPRVPVCRCRPRRDLRVVTARPVVPGEEERERNPRARSARLRVAERRAQGAWAGGSGEVQGEEFGGVG